MERLEIAGHAHVLGIHALLAGDLRNGGREKLDGRCEHDAVLARQFLLGDLLAVEIGDLAVTPHVELDDVEMLFDIVGDLRLGEIDPVGFAAIGAAALLPDDGEPLAGGG